MSTTVSEIAGQVVGLSELEKAAARYSDAKDALEEFVAENPSRDQPWSQPQRDRFDALTRESAAAERGLLRVAREA